VPAAPDPPSLDDYVVPRIQGEVTFDGRVNEAAWEAVDPLEAVAHYPTFGAPMTERTEFRMAYDDEYIYFSCRAYDSEPERILSTTTTRAENQSPARQTSTSPAASRMP
jgi:hypothetical protein